MVQWPGSGGVQGVRWRHQASKPRPDVRPSIRDDGVSLENMVRGVSTERVCLRRLVQDGGSCLALVDKFYR